MDFQQALQAVSGGYPQLFGRVAHVSPTPVQQETPTEPTKEEKPKERKPEKRIEPKKKSVPDVDLVFPGRIADEPAYYRALDVFGLDPDDIAPSDRNKIADILRLVARKLGTTDSTKILGFIRRESHGLSGGYREMFRMLVLQQKPEKRQSPWGNVGR